MEKLDKSKNIFTYGQLRFRLYFNDEFVGYEQWGERGWMYSIDGEVWGFDCKYAHNKKILEN